LGFVIDALRLTIHIPLKKPKTVRNQVRQTLRHNTQQRLKLGHLATTVGQAIALLPACQEGLLHSSELHRLQSLAASATGWRRSTPVTLSTAAKAELKWWETFLERQRKRPTQALAQSLELAITASDASDHTIAGVVLSKKDLPYFLRRLSRKERKAHINVKEAQALHESLLSFETELAGKHVNARLDSLVIVHAVNKWGCKQPEVRNILEKIFAWCLKTNTILTATYVNTRANRMADGLSRNKLISRAVRAETLLFANSIRWQRSHRLRWLMRKKPYRALLRTAKIKPRSNLSAQNPRLSETPSLIPRGPLATNFRRRKLLSFPDLHRIQRTLDTVVQLGTQVTVVVPLWHYAPWFAHLARLTVAPPVTMHGTSCAALNQHTPSNPSWLWIGVTLSGRRKDRTKFRQQLRSLGDWEGLPSKHIGQDGKVYEKYPTKAILPMRTLLEIQMKARH
jgi:hypothetical protein